MVKALTDRLKELNATAAGFQVMVNGCEKKLREAAHGAPPGPLAQRWVRALGRGGGVRTPPTGPGRDCGELSASEKRESRGEKASLAPALRGATCPPSPCGARGGSCTAGRPGRGTRHGSQLQ